MSATTIEKTKKSDREDARSNGHISFLEQKLNKMRSILDASPVPAELLRRDSDK